MQAEKLHAWDANCGHRLQTAIKESGHKQNALAKALRMGEGTLGNYLKGTREPPATLLYDIALICDRSVDWIITGEEKGESVTEKKMKALQAEHVRVLTEMVQLQQRQIDQLTGQKEADEKDRDRIKEDLRRQGIKPLTEE